MILIRATIDVPQEHVEGLLKEAEPFIQGALDEPGCREYAWTIDPRTPGRIYVIEEWDDEPSLANHFASQPYRSMRDHIGSRGLNGAWSQKYLVAKAAPVYNADGTPHADFEHI